MDKEMLQITLFFQRISFNPESIFINCLENMTLLPVKENLSLRNKNTMHHNTIFNLWRLKEKQIFGMNSPLRNSLLH
jgi:hypothetical protein